MELRFEVKIRIQKPVDQVFDAVYSAEKLSRYFTTGGASGPMKEGVSVQWAFADNPGDEKNAFPVKVLESVPNEKIVFEWEGGKDHDTRVEIGFASIGSTDTVVSIRESGWNETQDELDRSYMNCFGWGEMLCCLKAYLEYGINLRNGAYTGIY